MPPKKTVRDVPTSPESALRVDTCTLPLWEDDEILKENWGTDFGTTTNSQAAIRNASGVGGYAAVGAGGRVQTSTGGDGPTGDADVQEQLEAMLGGRELVAGWMRPEEIFSPFRPTVHLNTTPFWAPYTEPGSFPVVSSGTQPGGVAAKNSLVALVGDPSNVTDGKGGDKKRHRASGHTAASAGGEGVEGKAKKRGATASTSVSTTDPHQGRTPMVAAAKALAMHAQHPETVTPLPPAPLGVMKVALDGSRGEGVAPATGVDAGEQSTATPIEMTPIDVVVAEYRAIQPLAQPYRELCSTESTSSAIDTTDTFQDGLHSRSQPLIYPKQSSHVALAVGGNQWGHGVVDGTATSATAGHYREKNRFDCDSNPVFFMYAFNSAVHFIHQNQAHVASGNYLWELIYPHAPGTCHPIYNPHGKYAVKLYVGGAYRKVVVDDLLPVNLEGKPLLTVTRKKELWPAILAKAVFQALEPTYRALLISQPLVILQALLGGWVPSCLHLERDAVQIVASLRQLALSTHQPQLGSAEEWEAQGDGQEIMESTGNRFDDDGGHASSSADIGENTGTSRSPTTVGGMMRLFAVMATDSRCPTPPLQFQMATPTTAGVKHLPLKMAGNRTVPEVASLTRAPTRAVSAKSLQQQQQLFSVVGAVSSGSTTLIKLSTTPRICPEWAAELPYNETATASEMSEGASDRIVPSPATPEGYAALNRDPCESSAAGFAVHQTQQQQYEQPCMELWLTYEELATHFQYFITWCRIDDKAGVFHHFTQIANRGAPCFSHPAIPAPPVALPPPPHPRGGRQGFPQRPPLHPPRDKRVSSADTSSDVFVGAGAHDRPVSNRWLNRGKLVDSTASMVIKWLHCDTPSPATLMLINVGADSAPPDLSTGAKTGPPLGTPKLVLGGSQALAASIHSTSIDARSASLGPKGSSRAGEDGSRPSGKPSTAPKAPRRHGDDVSLDDVGGDVRDANAEDLGHLGSRDRSLWEAGQGNVTACQDAHPSRREVVVELFSWDHALSLSVVHRFTYFSGCTTCSTLAIPPGQHLYRITCVNLTQGGGCLALLMNAPFKLGDDLGFLNSVARVFPLSDAGRGVVQRHRCDDRRNAEDVKTATVWSKRIIQVTEPTQVNISLLLLPWSEEVSKHSDMMKSVESTTPSGGRGAKSTRSGSKSTSQGIASSSVNVSAAAASSGGQRNAGGQGAGADPTTTGVGLGEGDPEDENEDGGTTADATGISANSHCRLSCVASAADHHPASCEADTVKVALDRLARHCHLLLVNLDTNAVVVPEVPRKLWRHTLEPNRAGYLIMAYVMYPALVGSRRGLKSSDREVADGDLSRPLTEAFVSLPAGDAARAVPPSRGAKEATSTEVSVPPSPQSSNRQRATSTSRSISCESSVRQAITGSQTSDLSGNHSAPEDRAPPRCVWKLNLISNRPLENSVTLPFSAASFKFSGFLERGGTTCLFRYICTASESVSLILNLVVQEQFGVVFDIRVCALQPDGTDGAVVYSKTGCTTSCFAPHVVLEVPEKQKGACLYSVTCSLTKSFVDMWSEKCRLGAAEQCRSRLKLMESRVADKCAEECHALLRDPEGFHAKATEKMLERQVEQQRRIEAESDCGQTPSAGSTTVEHLSHRKSIPEKKNRQGSANAQKSAALAQEQASRNHSNTSQPAPLAAAGPSRSPNRNRPETVEREGVHITDPCIAVHYDLRVLATSTRFEMNPDTSFADRMQAIKADWAQRSDDQLSVISGPQGVVLKRNGSGGTASGPSSAGGPGGGSTSVGGSGAASAGGLKHKGKNSAAHNVAHTASAATATSGPGMQPAGLSTGGTQTAMASFPGGPGLLAGGIAGGAQSIIGSLLSKRPRAERAYEARQQFLSNPRNELVPYAVLDSVASPAAAAAAQGGSSSKQPGKVIAVTSFEQEPGYRHAPILHDSDFRVSHPSPQAAALLASRSPTSPASGGSPAVATGGSCSLLSGTLATGPTVGNTSSNAAPKSAAGSPLHSTPNAAGAVHGTAATDTVATESAAAFVSRAEPSLKQERMELISLVNHISASIRVESGDEEKGRQAMLLDFWGDRDRREWTALDGWGEDDPRAASRRCGGVVKDPKRTAGMRAK